MYKHIQNLDNNIKILLNNFNKLALPENKPVIKSEPINKPPMTLKLEDLPKKTLKFEDLPKTNRFEQMQDQAIPQETKEDELIEVGLQVGQQRVHRVPRQESKAVNVKQQVLYSDGAPVMVAMVEILNSDGNKVKTLRTNSKGHWTTPLNPGKYTFHIVKYVGPDSKRQSFDIRFDQDVPAGKEFVIPTPEIGG